MKNTKKKDPKTLGERIRYLRGDLTQSEFADILRIKQAMVSRYEADKETPPPKSCFVSPSSAEGPWNGCSPVRTR